MKHIKLIFPIALVAWMTGCAQLDNTTVGSFVRGVAGEVQLIFHERGVSQLQPGDDVLRSDRCSTPGRFSIESHEVIPPRVRSGREIGMSWIYNSCSPSGSPPKLVRVTYQVLFDGSVIWSESQRRMDISPGRWRVNNIITIPKQASPGRYEWVVRVDGPGVSGRSAAGFQVTG